MRTIIILLSIVLYAQIHAQDTKAEKSLFIKVVTKFRDDTESFNEFKHLGLCHCISNVLEEDLFL